MMPPVSIKRDRGRDDMDPVQRWFVVLVVPGLIGFAAILAWILLG
jgi:hypothetical protein